MSIKLYGNTRTFDDGDGGNIILNCNTRLFLLYKDLFKTDLLQDWINTQNRSEMLKNQALKHMTKKEYENMGIVELNAFCDTHNIKINIYENVLFMNHLILAMYINSLNEIDQREAIANQQNCLPNNFYMRADVINSAIELINNSFEVKKNHKKT